MLFQENIICGEAEYLDVWQFSCILRRHGKLRAYSSEVTLFMNFFAAQCTAVFCPGLNARSSMQMSGYANWTMHSESFLAEN